MCRHRIVFTNVEEEMCAVRAMQGRSNQTIAAEFGLTPGMVQYRISKAQRILGDGYSFRKQLRQGEGPLAEMISRQTTRFAKQFVARQIAPHFVSLAAQGVSRQALAA